MAGQMHTANVAGISVSAANTPQDLIVLTAASNRAVKIHQVIVSQLTLIASEILSIKLHRGTGGSGGSAMTEVPLNDGSGVSGAAVVYSRTTQTTEADLLYAENWNVVQPFRWLPTPLLIPTITGGSNFVVELETDASATMDMNLSISYEEIG